VRRTRLFLRCGRRGVCSVAGAYMGVFGVCVCVCALQAVTDARGVDANGVGANSAQPHGLG